MIVLGGEGIKPKVKTIRDHGDINVVVRFYIEARVTIRNRCRGRLTRVIRPEVGLGRL